MSRAPLVAVVALAALVVPFAVACGGQVPAPKGPLAEMDQTRESPAMREAHELAPQAYAEAEVFRGQAHAAEAEGDAAGASLLAERALAAYTRASALARLARATREAEGAAAELAKAEEDARQLAAAREKAEREGDELEKQLAIAREALTPAASGPADPQRAAARLVAARALAAQARLLCGAAGLLAPSVAGLEEAQKNLDELAAQLEAPAAARTKQAPIDVAARARAGCLGLLTRARREGASRPGDADALLAELSAAGRWEPSRDERGVVLALRELFQGAKLRAEAEQRLAELGRVAAAHPAFAVQVVVHDAAAPGAAERAADQKRGDACAQALIAAGAATARVRVELAGARAPVVDPEDPAHRARNERVEIVFVAPGG